MRELRSEPLVKLRGMAQSFGVSDIFSKDAVQLSQAIESKQKAMTPAQVLLPPLPQYDARLMTKPPAKKCSPQELEEYLKPYTCIGMKLTISDERWQISHGKKTDEGSLRMPPRIIMGCAAKVME